MKEFPGGTWVTIEGKSEKEEVDIVAIGYKYNSKKISIFLQQRVQVQQAMEILKFSALKIYIVMCIRDMLLVHK